MRFLSAFILSATMAASTASGSVIFTADSASSPGGVALFDAHDDSITGWEEWRARFNGYPDWQRDWSGYLGASVTMHFDDPVDIGTFLVYGYERISYELLTHFTMSFYSGSDVLAMFPSRVFPSPGMKGSVDQQVRYGTGKLLRGVTSAVLTLDGCMDYAVWSGYEDHEYGCEYSGVEEVAFSSQVTPVVPLPGALPLAASGAAGIWPLGEV